MVSFEAVFSRMKAQALAQRDLLESYLAKYREATTREKIDTGPADGRIISRGTVSNIPAYPKKLPIVLIATLATLLFSTGLIATGELLRMTAPHATAAFASAPAPMRMPEQAPVTETVIAEEPEPVFSEAAIVPDAEVAASPGEIEQ